MKITDLKTLKIQNAALQKAIADAIAPFGLTLERQAGSIDPTMGKLKLTLSTAFVPEGMENLEEVDRKVWAESAILFGLPADAYGKQIMFSGVAYTIAALEFNRSKNNVSIRRTSDGKRFKTTAETVKRLLEKSNA